LAKRFGSPKAGKKPSTRPPGVIGFPWYRREEWDRLRAAAVDPAIFEQSYEQWEASAIVTLRNLRAQGFRVSKVDIALAELQAWCRKHNRPLDGAARGEFATRQLPGIVHHQSLPYTPPEESSADASSPTEPSAPAQEQPPA
jgi:hypothetical protein